MVNRSAEFASLLCSRLCHDLLSPLGALNNGLELLADESDPKIRERCMELFTEGAQAAANRLRFFQIAFAAGGQGEQVDTTEAQRTLEALHANGKVRLGWMVEAQRLPGPAIKVLMNLALIAGDALPEGGQLDVAAEGGEIVVRAEGPRLALDADVRNALLGQADPDLIGRRAAAAWFVHLLVSDHGGSVQLLEPGDGVLMFGTNLPN